MNYAKPRLLQFYMVPHCALLTAISLFLNLALYLIEHLILYCYVILYQQKYEEEVKKRELKRAPGSGLNSELHKLFEALKNPDAAVPATVATLGAGEEILI